MDAQTSISPDLLQEKQIGWKGTQQVPVPIFNLCCVIENLEFDMGIEDDVSNGVSTS